MSEPITIPQYERVTRSVALSTLRYHPKNPREGNVDQIIESIKSNGVYRAITVQKSTNYVCAGNHTLKAFRKLGIKRSDVTFVDVDDDVAFQILLADNKSSDDAKYNFVKLGQDLIEYFQRTGSIDGTLWKMEDVDAMLAGVDETEEEREDREKSDGSLLGLISVTIAEPTHQVEPGEVWELGRHILVCAEVATEWHLWKPFLEGDRYLAVYPGFYVPLALKAERVPLLMVAPDPYIAGKIIDTYVEVNGPKGVRKQ